MRARRRQGGAAHGGELGSRARLARIGGEALASRDLPGDVVARGRGDRQARELAKQEHASQTVAVILGEHHRFWAYDISLAI